MDTPVPTVAIDELTKMRDNYASGVEAIAKQIEKLKSDLTATRGAVQLLDKIIADHAPKPAAE